MSVDPLVPSAPAFLGQGDFQLRVAPLRRAFLVQDGRPDQMIRALQAAAALWGGARCPILPVDRGGVVSAGWLEVARILEVSEIVDFTAPSRGTSAWSAPEHVEWTIVPAPPLEDAHYWSLHPVAAVVEEGPPKEIFLPQDVSLLSLAGAGAYGLSEETPLFADAGFAIVYDNDDLTLAKMQLGERTAVGATMAEDEDTEIHGGDWSSLALLWVVEDRDSFNDAVWFWNARAARPRFRDPKPLSVITTPEVIRTETFRREFTNAVRNHPGSTPSFNIVSTSVAGRQLGALARSLGARRHKGQFRVRFGSATQREEPLSYALNADPFRLWLGARKVGKPALATVQLKRPEMTVSFHSPKGWAAKYVMSGKVTATVSSPAICGPQTPSVAHLYHQNAEWSDGGLRLITNNVPEYSFPLRLPTAQAILRAALAAQGADYRLSDKGQQVAGIITRDPDADFYRRRSTNFVVRMLTAKPGRDLARELKELRNEGLVSERSIDQLVASSLLGHRPHRRLSDLASEAVSANLEPGPLAPALEQLVARGGAEMGLSVVCPLCSLVDFQPMKDIDGGATCRGCGSRAGFKKDPRGAPEVHYQLNSLMHTLSLNGGLVPLAAAALLGSEKAFIEPGANLLIGGRVAGEVDLLGWAGSDLMAGEAKTSATGFAKSDIEGDVAKAAVIQSSQYLAVCPDLLSAETRSRLAKACQAVRIELRILEGAELLVEG